MKETSKNGSGGNQQTANRWALLLAYEFSGMLQSYKKKEFCKELFCQRVCKFGAQS